MVADRRQSAAGASSRSSAMRDRARKRAEEREGQGGGGTKYNLPEGVSFFSAKKHANLDIIPYVVSVDNHPENIPKGELWYQRTVFVHFSVGAENKSYLCPRTIRKKCPICEHRTQMMKDGNQDEEAIKNLKAKERELFNVFDRDETDKGVQFWDVSPYNFGDKLEEEIREGKEAWGGFAEPIDGFTLKMRFTEEQVGRNKFLQASRIDFEERKSIDKKLLAAAIDLDKILKVLSYEALEKIFLEVDDENGEGEEKTDADQNARRVRPDRDTSSEEQEEAAPEERPQRRNPSSQEKAPEKSSSRREARQAAKKESLECPAGGTFGKDCDELDECKDCTIWEKCIEEQERMNSVQ